MAALARFELAVTGHEGYGKAEVTELGFPCGRENDVLRLYVRVHDAWGSVVQLGDRIRYGCQHCK